MQPARKSECLEGRGGAAVPVVEMGPLYSVRTVQVGRIETFPAFPLFHSAAAFIWVRTPYGEWHESPTLGRFSLWATQ